MMLFDLYSCQSDISFFNSDDLTKKQMIEDSEKKKKKTEQMKKKKLLIQLIDDELVVPGENVFVAVLKVSHFHLILICKI